MLVATSFDLWRKDAFFSAAEEVQESADIMESAYRAWIREREEKSNPDELDELCRELQIALGTAKWQLEEFEKAVRLSYSHLRDENTSTRHRQFISAIENQISHVEATLRESYIENDRQPPRWVNLDDEERDDLAAFLSGTPRTIRTAKDESVELTPPAVKSSAQEKQVNKNDKDFNVNAANDKDISTDEKASEDAIASNIDCIVEIRADTVSRTSDEVVSLADRTSTARKTWNSPNVGALRIVIPNDYEQRNELKRSADATPKQKGFKPVFWKQKSEEYPQAMRAVHMVNQFFGRIGWSQRHFQSPPHLRHGCSVQFTLALMLTIFLIVPFVIYST